MKPIVKIYLKVFLITGLGFAILNTGSDYFFGLNLYIWRFVFNIIFFGGIMSLILVEIHKAERRSRGINEFTEENSKLIYEKKFKSKMSMDHLLESLKENMYFASYSIKNIEGKLVLKSRMSMLSWGEIITIGVEDLDESFYEFTVNSKPKYILTLLDGGANYKNLRVLEKMLLIK